MSNQKLNKLPGISQSREKLQREVLGFFYDHANLLHELGEKNGINKYIKPKTLTSILEKMVNQDFNFIRTIDLLSHVEDAFRPSSIYDESTILRYSVENKEENNQRALISFLYHRPTESLRVSNVDTSGEEVAVAFINGGGELLDGLTDRLIEDIANLPEGKEIWEERGYIDADDMLKPGDSGRWDHPESMEGSIIPRHPPKAVDALKQIPTEGPWHAELLQNRYDSPKAFTGLRRRKAIENSDSVNQQEVDYQAARAFITLGHNPEHLPEAICKHHKYESAEGLEYARGITKAAVDADKPKAKAKSDAGPSGPRM